MKEKPDRALTHADNEIETCGRKDGRNEGKARQGIDTPRDNIQNIFLHSRNEGKARQGIDTFIIVKPSLRLLK